MLTAGMKTLGDRLRELRDERDFSLREFAKKLEATAAHLSDIENGRRYPSPELLAKMAHVLGVKVEDLEQHDDRAPVDDLRRIVRRDPAFGFALRKLAETDVSADDILKLVKDKPKRNEK